MDRLQEKYQNEVCKAMTEKFGYKNVMQLPKIEKVIINIKTFLDGHLPPDRVHPAMF